MRLEGSCHCGAVHFTLESTAPCPYMHCHCSICRKTAGGGGYAINIGGRADSMRVRGKKHLGIYHAVMRPDGTDPKQTRARRSPAQRHFCLRCGSALWIFDPRWPDHVYPHASAIDTPLPRPPEVVEASLAFAAPWVDVPAGKGHVHCRLWPEESLQEWHERHRLTTIAARKAAGARSGDAGRKGRSAQAGA